MELYKTTLAIALLTTGLLAGFFFAFTMLIMPGLKGLSDGEFIRAFQAIDRILQPNAPAWANTRPVFFVVFVGSIVAQVAALILGFPSLSTVGRLLLVAAVAIIILGMLAPTVAVNLPLNNEIQTYTVDAMTEPEHAAARHTFEARWNRWNLVRTLASSLSFAFLAVLSLNLERLIR